MKRPFKRQSIPFTENGYKAIEKLAAANGSSIALTTMDWIEESHTMILRLAEAIDLAKSNPALAHKLMQKIAFEAQKDLVDEQLDMLEKQ